MFDQNYKAFQLFIAAWLLTGNDTIPASDKDTSTLQRAFLLMSKAGTLPEILEKILIRSDGPNNTCCLKHKLEELFHTACFSKLGYFISPEYHNFKIAVSENLCRRLLKKAQISKEAAVSFGNALRKIIAEIEK